MLVGARRTAKRSKDTRLPITGDLLSKIILASLYFGPLVFALDAGANVLNRTICKRDKASAISFLQPKMCNALN
jgi:hypothetical protein